MKLRAFVFASAIVAFSLPSFAASTSVAANNGYNAYSSGSKPALTDLGSFSAGVYSITATGTIGLTPSGNFMMTADGIPASPVTDKSYLYFNPTGSVIADHIYGFAGSSFKIGALVGTLSTNPTSSSDWFLIGSATKLTLSATSHIYAAVNDTYSINDTGAFSVTVTSVPEPEVYAMLLAGLGLMGAIARRRKSAQA